MLRRREIVVSVGVVEASRDAVVLGTVLGSCVAVCLYDPVARVGGMNHFSLPAWRRGLEARTSARFGTRAMPALVAALVALGADPGRLVAKLFGGAQLLGLPLRNDIAPRNVACARGFLVEAAIAVIGGDFGGHHARHVRFEPDTGRVRVRRVNTGSEGEQAAAAARRRPAC